MALRSLLTPLQGHVLQPTGAGAPSMVPMGTMELASAFPGTHRGLLEYGHDQRASDWPMEIRFDCTDFLK